MGVSVNELLEGAYKREHGEEPSGLLVLPHFTGAATPHMDTGSGPAPGNCTKRRVSPDGTIEAKERGA